MTLDRAWSRRPFASAPYFGQSVPELWAETAVTFTTNAPVENSLGGFSDGTATEVGPVMASVSIDTDVPARSGSDQMRGVEASGPIVRRRYLVIIDPAQFAAFPGYAPVKGDTMAFQDPRFGDTPSTTVIETATMPEGIGDHWELESELFE